MVRVKIDGESEYRRIFEIGQLEHPFSYSILEKFWKKNQTFECHLLSLLRGSNIPKSHSKGIN